MDDSFGGFVLVYFLLFFVVVVFGVFWAYSSSSPEQLLRPRYVNDTAPTVISLLIQNLYFQASCETDHDIPLT